jgi:hypothetical protein
MALICCRQFVNFSILALLSHLLSPRNLCFPTKVKGGLGGFECSFAFVSTPFPNDRSAVTHQSQFVLCGYVLGRRDNERYFKRLFAVLLKSGEQRFPH